MDSHIHATAEVNGHSTIIKSPNAHAFVPQGKGASELASQLKISLSRVPLTYFNERFPIGRTN